jgi:hypothetical protein
VSAVEEQIDVNQGMVGQVVDEHRRAGHGNEVGEGEMPSTLAEGKPLTERDLFEKRASTEIRFAPISIRGRSTSVIIRHNIELGGPGKPPRRDVLDFL